jgi:hypothetical protein
MLFRASIFWDMNQIQQANLIKWLLEEDKENPSVRYFALRELLDRPESDDQVRKARSTIMESGPVPIILEAQEPSGAWVMPGGGYSPKYRATAWSLLILAELGADPDEDRIRLGCEYYLGHSLAKNEAFSVYRKPVPSGSFHCLNGNMIFALRRLGYGQDPRVLAARDWLARSIVGQQPITYYASGVTAPGFACRVNEKEPCAWGANKAIRALLNVPQEARTPVIEHALEVGAEFLLSHDPVVADYPYTGRVSSSWFKLIFPLSYWSDVLETLSNLVELGYGQDPRLSSGLAWLAGKQDDHGRWKLENSLNGKMWVDVEAKGKPSKWITLRALRVLKGAGLYEPVS